MYSTLIDTAALQRHLTNPDWVVVDCRFDLHNPGAGRGAYAQGHIPGARYADLNAELAGPVSGDSGRHPLPDPQVLAGTLGAWGIHNRTQVVAYDAKNSAFAVRLWWLLRWLGHESVAVLNGGLAAWEAAGLPLSTQPPSVTPARFEARPDHAALVQAEVLASGQEAGRTRLVDARAEARFRGEQEPIDPVAGHIPGAINLPFEANLQENGEFRPAEELAARFSQFAENPEQVVHMCGSGVTACHNLLAMELAGLHGSRLYPGSWSQWIADPQRPVEKD